MRGGLMGQLDVFGFCKKTWYRAEGAPVRCRPMHAMPVLGKDKGREGRAKGSSASTRPAESRSVRGMRFLCNVQHTHCHSCSSPTPKALRAGGHV